MLGSTASPDTVWTAPHGGGSGAGTLDAGTANRLHATVSTATVRRPLATPEFWVGSPGSRPEVTRRTGATTDIA